MSEDQTLRRKGEKLRGRERQVVLNVFTHFHESLSVTEACKETAKATGSSLSTVYRVRKEASRGALVTPSKIRKIIQPYKNARSIVYDDYVRSGVRRKAHEMLFRNIPPTLKSILNSVNMDEDLPNFKRSTLYRLLTDIGFVHERRGTRSILIERDDIIRSRHKYLRQLHKYRNEQRVIVYTDETWVNIGQTLNVKTPHQPFLAGMGNGMKTSNSRGGRFAVLHAGTETGFIEGALRVFLCKKTADENDEVDGERYENWFEHCLLPNLPKGSVIVLDNAPHHSRKVESLPTAGWGKDTIKEWLVSKKINFDEDSLKRDLLFLVNEVREEFEKLRIDELASTHGFTILRLPSYHWELNPMEMVWAQVKHYVGMRNFSFKEKDVEVLISESLETVSIDNWKNYIQLVKKVEEEMWLADTLQDDVDELIIRLTLSSSPQSTSPPSTDMDEPQPSTSGYMKGFESLSDS